MRNKGWHEITSIWLTPVSVCLYLELICIIEVYAHRRDHPRLEQSCQDLFGNCICDEVEVEWVPPDMRKERNALVQRFLIPVLKGQHQNLQSFICVYHVKFWVYGMSGGVLLCGQNAEKQFEHTWPQHNTQPVSGWPWTHRTFDSSRMWWFVRPKSLVLCTSSFKKGQVNMPLGTWALEMIVSVSR